jgi:hypothetical protein
MINQNGELFVCIDATPTVLCNSTVGVWTFSFFINKGDKTTMTIPFPPISFNQSVPAGFDDPWQQRQHRVQGALHQLAPLAPDGGRMVLWRCFHCQKPWYEGSSSSAIVHLDQKASMLYASRLRLQCDLEDLPQALCPACSIRLIGGILRVEEPLCGSGYRFTWRSPDTSELWMYYLMLPDQHALAQLQVSGDLHPLLDASLSQPTDLLLSVPMLRHLLQHLERLPEPSLKELIPFTARHLHQVARQIPVPPAGYWRGSFWLPTRPVPELGDLLIIAAVAVTPILPLNAPVDLLEGWQLLFHNLVEYLP